MSMTWAELYKNLIERSIVASKPTSGFFELTSRCNFHCKMCYVCSMPDDKSFFENELSASKWIKLGEEARDAGLLFLTLSGGEIFMRKDFFDIYEALSEMGLNITLFTNGSLINKEKARRLGKKPPSKASITLYGSCPETYGKVTGHPEGFQNTINAVKLLLEEDIRVVLKTTVIKDNFDEFEAIHEIANDLGVHLGIVNYVAPRREGFGTDPENSRLSPRDLAMYEKRLQDFQRQYDDYRKMKTLPISIDRDIMVDNSMEELIKEYPHVSTSAFECTATKCAFWLTWDGKLAPCGLLTEPYVDIKELGFEEAWGQLKKLALDIPSCKACGQCTYRNKCMVCPARLKVETGHFDRPAPYLCELAKARKELDVLY